MSRLIALLVVWIPALASAQTAGPLVTDRPTQSAATYTLAPKDFQIEAGYKFTQLDRRDVVTDVHALPDSLFRVGVWDRIEARVTVSGFDIKRVDQRTGRERSSGFNDVSFGGKLALTDESGPWPAFSVLGEVSVPVGSQGFTNDYVHPKVLALFSSTLSDTFGLTVNFGPNVVRSGRRTLVDLEYAAALSGTLSQTWALFAEFYGAFGVGETRLSQHSFQTGVTTLLGRDVQIDGRIGVGFVDNVPTWLTGFGIGWRVFTAERR